jgi:predicted nicotinamide N-methyase
VLARYAILHREVFQDKFVMELGSGTGIAGIAVLKFTSCKNCLLSDYLPEVVENARRNCLKNNMNKAVVMKLNWKDYQSFNNRYDIIIGSDVIAPGAPTK